MHQTSSTCNTQICCNNGIPSTSKIRANLGSSLAQVFFAYSHDDTKNLLNLMEPLRSPKPCFPAPVDDSLRGDAATSLMNVERIKLDVHQNILGNVKPHSHVCALKEIGESIFARVQKEIEENLREGIEKQSQEKFHMYQARKRLEAERNILQLHIKYENYIKTVQHELEKQLEIQWANVAAKCVKNIQKAVVQERLNVTHEMMQKMRIEMTYVVESLYTDFEESFRAQRETIIADFNGIMRKEHVKLHKDKEDFEKRVARDLFIQKHQLEIQSTVDVIYVLCLERLRSSREKHAMHTYFQKQIDGFRESIVQLNNILTMMRDEISNCHVEKKLLEEKFCDVTEQFQKFINFVFHAVPGQAEYLLPLELQRLIPSNSAEKKNSKGKNLSASL